MTSFVQGVLGTSKWGWHAKALASREGERVDVEGVNVCSKERHLTSSPSLRSTSEVASAKRRGGGGGGGESLLAWPFAPFLSLRRLLHLASRVNHHAL